MKEVSKVYLTSFEKANYISTKKPKSMIQTVMNLTKNETTKRSKAKRQTEIETLVNKELQVSQALNQVVSYNIVRYLHSVGVLKFQSDKDTDYCLEKVR